MSRLGNHGTMRANQLDVHNTVRFLHTNNTYHHDLVGIDATSANITTTLPNHTGTLLTHTIKDHVQHETDKHLRFGSANGGVNCYIKGDDATMDINATNLNLQGTTSSSFRGGTVNIDAAGTLNLQASDAENYVVCNHSTEAVEAIKPLHIKSTSKVEDHCNFLTDKELRFGTASGGANCRIKGNNTVMDINSHTINLQGTTTTSLRGGTINIDAGGTLNLKASDDETFIGLNHSTDAVEVHKPIITKAGATTTYTGDDGSIPITASLVSIDAGGSARGGLRFASGGTLGQIIIVHNVGGEKLTFDNDEAVSLVKSVHSNHDTMESASVYMFVSTGAKWCIIGGGKGSGTQLVGS